MTPDQLQDQQEVWKPVSFFADGGEKWPYLVSSVARVMRIDDGRILTQHPDKDGYLRVFLRKPGCNKTVRVHQLVARAYLRHPAEGEEVNHRDGVKTNNLPSNLEWLTSQDNHRHAAVYGLKAHGEKHGLSKLTTTQVLDIRHNPRGLTQQARAEMYGVDITTIERILQGKTWKHLFDQEEETAREVAV